MSNSGITSVSTPAIGLAFATASDAPQTVERGWGIAWWVWLLILLVPLALAIWWWLRRSQRGAAQPVEPEITLPEPRMVAGSAVPLATPAPELLPAVDAPAPEAPPVVEAPAAEPLPAVEAPAPVAVVSEAAVPDDLTRIEGIGPVISRRFQEAGIATFAQLAAADVDHLKQILLDAKLRLANPETWPEQARLAVAGDWDALAALQADLKGGRVSSAMHFG